MTTKEKLGCHLILLLWGRESIKNFLCKWASVLFFSLKNVSVLKIFSAAQPEGTCFQKQGSKKIIWRTIVRLSALLYYLKNTEEFKLSEWRQKRAVGCWLYPSISVVICFFTLKRIGVTLVIGINLCITGEVTSDLISNKLFSSGKTNYFSSSHRNC